MISTSGVPSSAMGGGQNHVHPVPRVYASTGVGHRVLDEAGVGLAHVVLIRGGVILGGAHLVQGLLPVGVDDPGHLMPRDFEISGLDGGRVEGIDHAKWVGGLVPLSLFSFVLEDDEERGGILHLIPFRGVEPDACVDRGYFRTESIDGERVFLDAGRTLGVARSPVADPVVRLDAPLVHPGRKDAVYEADRVGMVSFQLDPVPVAPFVQTINLPRIAESRQP